ncbi:hypothetical protein WJ0W_006208 [Paenibacillus melissococcoides]|uniref:Uncharacterized protein n=1 Tax=Paenibacillus melissococcoides TaxID=2912268 RepID=A0ABM9GAE9_9BACL|nr:MULTISPECIES: hypothetical protein [Paenibacillus]CAH8246857.1 hypothetical protein WJ0W_004089 [Paenibacillus melissococcoides]CAH8249021.1 hypothetical protein WJ0W_006208 [Paenibacillus melissococcoides]CAH8710736.1 hypothetical protein HTL2_002732 [Paenibacillus melissococcoides]CAH8715966.1 hypothetical protein HTL2_004459 [Paenibacillus melissococcoides]CAH8716920.1 hypothetical protein WDD9_004726 [Paenibacillus melissococcoides]
MTYATAADYDRYGDGLIPAEQLDKALGRASDQVDRLTYNRIVAWGFDNLTPFQRTNVTKAVCQQADFVFRYGDYLTMPISGYSAGSTSMSFKAATGARGVHTSDEVINLLMSTGLTHRGIW